MNPAMLALFVQWIPVALANAPKAIEMAKKLKDFIAALFSSGAITKATQDALNAHVDAVQALVDLGVVPSHWQVEADPV